jgi:hypothetical protein
MSQSDNGLKKCELKNLFYLLLCCLYALTNINSNDNDVK